MAVTDVKSLSLFLAGAFLSCFLLLQGVTMAKLKSYGRKFVDAILEYTHGWNSVAQTPASAV